MSKKSLALQIAVLVAAVAVALLSFDFYIEALVFQLFNQTWTVPAEGMVIYQSDKARLLVPEPLYPGSLIVGSSLTETENGRGEWATVVSLATPDSPEKVKQYYLEKWRRYGVKETRCFVAEKIGIPGISLIVNPTTDRGTNAWVDIVRVAPIRHHSIFLFDSNEIYNLQPPQPGNQETQIIFFIPAVPTK
jgi:hypothetical protein